MMRIILVDDNHDACETAAKYLRWAGDYEVEMAYDGRSALRLFADNNYALAVIDYQLPDMNGIELFRQAKVIRPDLKAIFVTGYPTIDVVFPAIDAGVLRVLAKPVEFEELIPVIDDYVFDTT
jgi:DNA-binding NtrC family response regulator